MHRFVLSQRSSLAGLRFGSSRIFSTALLPTLNRGGSSGKNRDDFSWALNYSLICAALTASTLAADNAYCSSSTKNATPRAPGSAENLPVYRAFEVAKHKTKETGVWVTYLDGVYDITNFIPNHPGGQDKIILAAGGAVEPFWVIYRQHYNSKAPMEQLAKMRIGTLHPSDVAAAAAATAKLDQKDPYSKDPILNPVLKAHQLKPINAEPPGSLLTDSWITPKEMWFVRNHHPVPTFAPSPTIDKEYKVTITGRGLPKGTSERVFTLEEIKNLFKKHTIAVSIQCGGNRRGEMNSEGLTSGTPWGCGAISTAVWGGARLRDVIKAAGVDLDEDALENMGVEHVQFAGAEGMEASIPSMKALSKRGDVLLAYEMNGEPLTPGNGYPLRIIVPGHAGVRNVKWVSKVTLSNEEAHGPWQRGMAYKGFGPSTLTTDGINVEKIPSLQEQPVQSAISIPSAGVELVEGDIVTMSGFAYSGGGRGIVRVDVSADGGKTWKTATLGKGSEQPLDRAWAWTLWECDVEIPKGVQSTELICKATDASYNVQPDTIKGIWNLRGINNNAWHRVKVKVVPESNQE